MIDAKVGEWVSIARRKGSDWFVGSITNWTSREINLPLSFLSPGKYNAEIYSDAADVDENPNHLTQQKIIISNSDTLRVHLVLGVVSNIVVEIVGVLWCVFRGVVFLSGGLFPFCGFFFIFFVYKS